MVHLALVTQDAAGRTWTPPYFPLPGLRSASNWHRPLDSSVLPGGSRSSVLAGGSGSSVLPGGSRSSVLAGGSGSSVLPGGSGSSPRSR